MTTLLSTRVKGPLLKEVEEIASATDLGVAEILRLGLRHVISEYKCTGGIKIPNIDRKKGARK